MFSKGNRKLLISLISILLLTLYKALGWIDNAAFADTFQITLYVFMGANLGEHAFDFLKVLKGLKPDEDKK